MIEITPLNKFAKIFTPLNALIAALLIINSTEKSNYKDRLLDIDFKLKNGVVTSLDLNTWIKFDVNMSKSVFSSVLTSMLLIYEHEDRILLMLKWKKIISVLLETKYKDQLADKLRLLAFNNLAKKDFMPINSIKVSLILFNLPTLFDYIISVHKNTPQGVLGFQGLGALLYTLCLLKSISPELAFALKKLTDERYKYASAIETKKYIYNLLVTLWVDFTILK